MTLLLFVLRLEFIRKMNRLLLKKDSKSILTLISKQARQFIQDTTRYIGLSRQQQVTTVLMLSVSVTMQQSTVNNQNSVISSLCIVRTASALLEFS